MKKTLKKVFSVILATSVMMCICACGGQKDAAKETKKEEIVVTFMNGDNKLGEVNGIAGEKLTGYEKYENIQDFEFLGWYETPTLLETSKKDLSSATFDASTTLYGSFKSTKVAEDSRKWYIVGTGTCPELAASNWASDVEDDVKASCELKATGKATNEFSITVNLYEGDQFQVIHDWAWDGQKGYGCFTSIDDTQMANGGGLGGSDTTSNVNVVMDGNYTITLTTDPDNELQDTLSIVRNGDATATEEEKTTEPETKYTVSEATGITVKGSWVSDWSDIKELTRQSGTNKFSITMDLEAGIELYFMVYDNGEDTGLGMNSTAVVDDASKALIEDAYNIKVINAGTYTFTVDADTMTVEVSK